MYFDNHGPPHFHALYGGDEALVASDSLTVLHGHLPPRALGLVVEWALLRQAELREAWQNCPTEMILSRSSGSRMVHQARP